MRFKEGSIPSIYNEYQKFKKLEKHGYEKKSGMNPRWYDYVKEIPYRNTILHMAEYKEIGKETRFYFITDLPIERQNVEALIESGRKR